MSFPPHPIPGGIPSRSIGMPNRREGPPSIWHTHGNSGNVFVNPDASSSAPHPEELNQWSSSIEEPLHSSTVEMKKGEHKIKIRDSSLHVWALGLSCENPAASGPPGLHMTTRELQTCTFERTGASNTTKIPRKRPTKEGGKNKNCGGRGKKSAKFWAPPFGSPQLRRHTTSGPAFSGFGPPFGPPTPSGPPTPPNFGPHYFGPHYFWVWHHTLWAHHDTHTRSQNRLSKIGLAKIGLTKIGQIRMAKTGLARCDHSNERLLMSF